MTGPWSLAAAALLAAASASPFTAEQPTVRQGNERLLSGDAQGALERYDAAGRELQATGPHPELEYDRGNALYALGRHAEAREAWKQALDADRAGALSSRALQNMGNALDALGDKEGALRALSQALTRDPANEDARYNLEVLLRRRAEGKGAPKDQGEKGQRQPKGPAQPGPGQRPPEQDQPQQGQQGPKPEPQPGEQAKAQQAPRPGEAKDQGAKPESKEGQAGASPGERKAGKDARGAAPGEGLEKQDAERLLDALRARERNMPLGPAGRKEARRKDVEKDW